LKAFVGRHGGAVCTSSNARAVVTWALGRGDKLLFFPDQHLGRNTGYQLGMGASDMRVWNPKLELGGLEEKDVKEATLLLWKGHCSVHQRFKVAHVEAFRASNPGGIVVVHPECAHEVIEVADQVGSTDFIIKAVEAAPAGSVIGVGTEIHLVQRLAAEHPDRTVVSLDPLICPCSTMFRIDSAHLAWVLENLVAGNVVNQIKVDPETGIVEDAKFKTFGCGSAIASSSLVTEWVKGKTIDEVLQIKNSDIVEELNLPPVKIHCSVLAEDAVKSAIADFRKKQAARKQTAEAGATKAKGADEGSDVVSPT
jgi:hypothetical protein